MNIDKLSNEELSFFKKYGYLVKRKGATTEQCQQVLDLMWTSAPENLNRDDPGTWGPIPQEMESADPLLIKQGSRWQYRAAATDPLLIDLVFGEQMRCWAEDLLGENSLRPPVVDGKPMGSWGSAWPNGPIDPQFGEGVRGIYATLPEQSKERKADSMHTDGHPFHLGAVILLEDNPPDGGNFKVWPGSHQRFYPLFPMQYDQARIPYYDHLPSHKGIIHPQEYLAEVTQVEADIEAVDCYGEAGDVVFWHHRLGHMAGFNYAETPTIRQAVLYDFCKTDLDTCRQDPPQENMWRDWSDQVNQANEPISKQFAAEQRLPLSLMDT
ncbi:MAG: hypothetical protein ACJAX5_000505 [Patiriisocius sp.]|jgi:hypothetical protein